MVRRREEPFDRIVTVSGAMKFMVVILAVMLCFSLIIETWPISGIFLVVVLIGALQYFKKRRK